MVNPDLVVSPEGQRATALSDGPSRPGKNPQAPISWHGEIHLMLAIVAFIGGAFGTLLLSMRFGENEATREAKKIALILGSVSTLLFVFQFAAQFLFLHFSMGYYGLTERLFLGSVLLWILIMSVYMVSHRRTMLVVDRSSQIA